MAQEVIYGSHDARTPSGLDWVTAVNEDLGFTANLVTGTNETIETTIPYPQEWDPEDEVLTMYEIEMGIAAFDTLNDDTFFALSGYLSMIDRSAVATFSGDLNDANDEWFKSLFAKQMRFGFHTGAPTVGTGANLVSLNLDVLRNAVYRPKLPIPAFFPVYYEMVNHNITVVATTGDETLASFTIFEKVFLSYDYTIRKMRRREKAFFEGLPGMQQRWAQLGS